VHVFDVRVHSVRLHFDPLHFLPLLVLTLAHSLVLQLEVLLLGLVGRLIVLLELVNNPLSFFLSLEKPLASLQVTSNHSSYLEIVVLHFLGIFIRGFVVQHFPLLQSEKVQLVFSGPGFLLHVSPLGKLLESFLLLFPFHLLGFLERLQPLTALFFLLDFFLEGFHLGFSVELDHVQETQLLAEALLQRSLFVAREQYLVQRYHL
jgi:hypothetical protein